MLDRQLHKFYLSYKLDGEVHLKWIEGINLRHAKEKIELMHENVSDLMDWTNEKEEDLHAYLAKIEAKKIAKELHVELIVFDNKTGTGITNGDLIGHNDSTSLCTRLRCRKNSECLPRVCCIVKSVSPVVEISANGLPNCGRPVVLR